MRSTKLRTLTQCAILLAMSTVLSGIKIIELPFEGSVTLLSMLPVCMVGLLHGPRWGIGTALLYSVIQLMASKCFAWGLTPGVLIVCILADYLVPFTSRGVTGFFRGRGRAGIIAAIALALGLRMVCHYISGVTIWREMAPEGWDYRLYSLVYNGIYMVPETIFTMIGAVILSGIPQIRKMLSQ